MSALLYYKWFFSAPPPASEVGLMELCINVRRDCTWRWVRIYYRFLWLAPFLFNFLQVAVAFVPLWIVFTFSAFPYERTSAHEPSDDLEQLAARRKMSSTLQPDYFNELR